MMKTFGFKRWAAILLALLLLTGTACAGAGTTDTQKDASTEEGGETSREDDESGSKGSQIAEGQSFAQAHDAFQTTLARQDHDSDPIPEPPEGLFDLVSYPSKVGDLAAYVSSDPGDGQKHPMIIWVVGGWGNGIDDFPFCYPAWDNDQTGSAFWQAGVLTMYPSFRGGNGNPGYYEALFGEVDDIVSAYEYAASLPYVDPSRIYLGGHSTGGTRALLAAEYTDKFRSVFCFGPVDEVKYHNNSQFTFDKSNEDEYTMRSPIHWLDNVKNPTFLIEGEEGNSNNLRNIQEASENENIHCYVLDGADHFSTLAPITRLLAEKILADTGAEPGIQITQEELEAAMKGEPVIPDPVMKEYTIDELGMAFSCPYIWTVEDISEEGTFQLSLYSPYDQDDIWDMASMYISVYSEDNPDSHLQEMDEYLQGEGYDTEATEVSGRTAIHAVGERITDGGSIFRNQYILVQKDGLFIEFDFYIHDDYGEDADPLFQAMMESVRFAE